jgi:PD-(D/E)XK endonuclease
MTSPSMSAGESFACNASGRCVAGCRHPQLSFDPSGPDGFIRRPYSRNEVDVVAGYAAELDRCYVLPPAVFEGHPAIQLRLAPARNNQLAGIRWARDFELDRLDFSGLGAIAQLGERLHGMQEVGGSSPPGSTTSTD